MERKRKEMREVRKIGIKRRARKARGKREAWGREIIGLENDEVCSKR